MSVCLPVESQWPAQNLEQKRQQNFFNQNKWGVRGPNNLAIFKRKELTDVFSFLRQGQNNVTRRRV